MTRDDPSPTPLGPEPLPRSEDQSTQDRLRAHADQGDAVRGRCLTFCARCGRPDTCGADMCPHCGGRRCVGCGE